MWHEVQRVTVALASAGCAVWQPVQRLGAHLTPTAGCFELTVAWQRTHASSGASLEAWGAWQLVQRSCSLTRFDASACFAWWHRAQEPRVSSLEGPCGS